MGNSQYKKLYKEIWNDRKIETGSAEYVDCVACGDRIYKHELNVFHFAHVRSKGARPDLKYDKDNIVIKCRQCHGQEHASGKFNNYLGK